MCSHITAICNSKCRHLIIVNPSYYPRISFRNTWQHTQRTVLILWYLYCIKLLWLETIFFNEIVRMKNTISSLCHAVFGSHSYGHYIYNQKRLGVVAPIILIRERKLLRKTATREWVTFLEFQQNNMVTENTVALNMRESHIVGQVSLGWVLL